MLKPSQLEKSEPILEKSQIPDVPVSENGFLAESNRTTIIEVKTLPYNRQQARRVLHDPFNRNGLEQTDVSLQLAVNSEAKQKLLTTLKKVTGTPERKIFAKPPKKKICLEDEQSQ